MEQPQEVYCLLCDHWQLLGMATVIAIVAYLCWMKIAQKIEHKHPFLSPKAFGRQCRYGE